MKGKKIRTGECRMCGECCRKMRITSVLSHILKQHRTLEEAGAYYSFHAIRLVKSDRKSNRVLLELDTPCVQLSENNKCLLHDSPEKKPLICHRYPWFKDDIETCGYSFE